MASTHFIYNFKQNPHNKDEIKAKTLKFNNSEIIPSKIVISYTLSLPVLVKTNAFDEFLNVLRNLCALEQINHITCTNINLYGNNAGLFDTLSNLSDQLYLRGKLIILNFKKNDTINNWNHMQRVYAGLSSLAHYYKNTYAISPSHDMYDVLVINCFMSTRLTEQRNDDNNTWLISNKYKNEIIIKYEYDTNYESGQYNMKKEDFFETIGFYSINDNNQIIYIPDIDLDGFNLIPVISFDIETIATNMDIVPLCTSVTEAISSIQFVVMFWEYKFTFTILLGSNKSHLIPKFNNFCNRYISKYENKYNHNSIYCVKTQTEMIEKFIELYVDGGMMKRVTGFFDYPHFLIGHNIIDYDLNVIVNNMITNKITMPLNRVSIESFPNKKKLLYRFNDNSIILDTLHIIKNNMLSDKMNLKDLTSHFVKNDMFKKMDLSAVLIRKTYLIMNLFSSSNWLIDKIFTINDTPIHFNNDYKDWMYNRIPHSLIAVTKQQLYELYKNDSTLIYNKSRYQIDEGYDQYWKVISPSNTSLCHLPDIEFVLNYNKLDCLSVIEIAKNLNIYTIGSAFSKMFNTSYEKGLVCGNSIRLMGYLKYSFYKHGYFMSYCEDKPIIQKVQNIDMNQITSLSLETLTNELNTNIYDRKRVIKNVKGKYAGAINMANQKKIIYNNNISGDFTSFYPSTIIANNFSSSNMDIISIGNLRYITHNTIFNNEILNTCLESNKIKIYIYDDPVLPTNLLCSPYYNGITISERIFSLSHLFEFNDNTRILIYSSTKHSFFKSIIQQLLDKRKMIKNTMKTLKVDSSDYLVLSALQLCYKIIANSCYGVLGSDNSKFKALSIAAGITLFCREKAIKTAKLFECFYYLQCQKRKQNVLHINGDPVNYKVVNECIYSIKYANSLDKHTTFQSIKIPDDMIKRYMDRSMILYADTDGIKFTNYLNLNNEEIALIFTQVNRVLEEVHGNNSIYFDKETDSDQICILAKKKYITIDKKDTGLMIKCTGFEKKANVVIKQIIDYTVRLVCWLYNNKECNDWMEFNVAEFLYDMFTYLNSLNQYQLVSDIPANYHKNQNTNLAKYITIHAPDYIGKIPTVRTDTNIDGLLASCVNPLSVDFYMHVNTWKTIVPKPNINYLKFLKPHFKTVQTILEYVTGNWSYTKCIHDILNCNRFDMCLACRNYYASHNVGKDILNYVYTLWRQETNGNDYTKVIINVNKVEHWISRYKVGILERKCAIKKIPDQLAGESLDTNDINSVRYVYYDFR